MKKIAIFISIVILFFSSLISLAEEKDYNNIQISEEKIYLNLDYIEIDINIPVIEELQNIILEEKINSLMKYELTNFAYNQQQEAKDLSKDLKENLNKTQFNYKASNTFEIFSTDNFISILIAYYQYTGGAHGLYWYKSYIINHLQEELVELDDILTKENSKEIILKEINKQIKANTDDYFVESVDYFNEENFYLTEKGIVFYYTLYELGPYVMGIPEFLIPWDSMEN